MKNDKTIYILYDVKTELPAMIGDANECARFLGINKFSFYSLYHCQKNGKGQPLKYEVVKLSEIEEEEE